MPMRAIFHATVVLVMSCVVQLSPAAAQQAEVSVPTMPKSHYRDGSRPPQYPPSLRREGIAGRVTAEFNIDVKGHIKDVKLETSGSDKLKKAVKEDIKDLVFDVPANWVESGGRSGKVCHYVCL
jgi:TonB family protein